MATKTGAASGAAVPGRGGRIPRQRERDAVLRLPRGDDLEIVSRSLGVTAATLTAWRDAFLTAGGASLTSRPADGEELESGRLKARLGEMLLKEELLPGSRAGSCPSRGPSPTSGPPPSPSSSRGAARSSRWRPTAAGGRATRALAALKAAPAEFGCEIEGDVRRSPVWREAEDLLTSVRGVGPATARAPSPGCPSSAPSTGAASQPSSASRPSTATAAPRGRKMISGGSASVRSALHMAALAAIRWNPAFRGAYDRLHGRGTPAKAAIVAVMRELLTVLNAMLRDKAPRRSA